MIDAAVIGLGRWGKNIVESVQGKSKRFRIIRGVSKGTGDDWEGGKILDPENGKEYSVRLTPLEGGPKLRVQGDSDQLEQLLINLFRNAVDAVRETGGSVRVGWQRLPGLSPATMELWVEDEGPGLSNTGNLFVPFFTTKPGGSGIGLVLSRQIAEGHSGTLMLENREDRTGCRASLRLPLQAAVPATR